ncbi:hypothetical protein GQ600_21547 [Phytophthora cactorum]|nr:hypothetical protein GQ600_21547 [Phytophthora cactorum]
MVSYQDQIVSVFVIVAVVAQLCRKVVWFVDERCRLVSVNWQIVLDLAIAAIALDYKCRHEADLVALQDFHALQRRELRCFLCIHYELLASRRTWRWPPSDLRRRGVCLSLVLVSFPSFRLGIFTEPQSPLRLWLVALLFVLQLLQPPSPALLA